MNMKRFLLSLLLCLGLFSCYTQTKFDLIKEQYNRTAAVMVLCVGEDPKLGSAVILKDDFLLTAGHVADCVGLVLIHTGDNQEGAGTVVKLDKTKDMAKIHAPGIKGYATVGPKPRAGDTVCVSPGWPNRNRMCGEVFYEHGNPDKEIRFSAIVQPGNSGAGLYDTKGRLVGIVTNALLCMNGQFCGGAATYIY